MTEKLLKVYHENFPPNNLPLLAFIKFSEFEGRLGLFLFPKVKTYSFCEIFGCKDILRIISKVYYIHKKLICARYKIVRTLLYSHDNKPVVVT